MEQNLITNMNPTVSSTFPMAAERKQQESEEDQLDSSFRSNLNNDGESLYQSAMSNTTSTHNSLFMSFAESDANRSNCETSSQSSCSKLEQRDCEESCIAEDTISVDTLNIMPNDKSTMFDEDTTPLRYSTMTRDLKNHSGNVITHQQTSTDDENDERDLELNLSQLSQTITDQILNGSNMTSDESETNFRNVNEEEGEDAEQKKDNTVIAANTANTRYPLNQIKNTKNNTTINDENQELEVRKLRLNVQRLPSQSNVIIESVKTKVGNEDGDGMQNVTKLPETKRVVRIYDTIEEFEANLPTTVTVLDTPLGSKVYLVGTVHFSEESNDDVSYVIRNVRPDALVVELCSSRIHILKLDEKTLTHEAQTINMSKIMNVIKTQGYITGLFSILLLKVTMDCSRQLGMAPGGEFRRAFQEVRHFPSCVVYLGDRPIRITLLRTLHALSCWQAIKLFWSLSSTGTISAEEVEECKKEFHEDSGIMRTLQKFIGEFPAFADVFLNERDQVLCYTLQKAVSEELCLKRPVRVVGVVGLAHTNGIIKRWGKVDPDVLPELYQIPKDGYRLRATKFLVKYGFLSLVMYGAFKLLRPPLLHIKGKLF